MTHVKFANRPFEKSINNMVDELMGGLPVLFNDGYNLVNKNGFVPVNISETGTNYVLEVAAPGFDKADFKVSLDDKILTVSAEKKAEEKKETENKSGKNSATKALSVLSQLMKK